MSLKAAREAAGLTQKEVAAILGVDDSAICQWETGRTSPLARRLSQIAEIYHCSIDTLLTDNTDDASEASMKSVKINI